VIPQLYQLIADTGAAAEKGILSLKNGPNQGASSNN
jgi:hypothetical protein